MTTKAKKPKAPRPIPADERDRLAIDIGVQVDRIASRVRDITYVSELRDRGEEMPDDEPQTALDEELRWLHKQSCNLSRGWQLTFPEGDA